MPRSSFNDMLGERLVPEVLEIFDGVMLGDGSLTRRFYGVRLHMSQSKTSKDGRLTMEDNFAWLAYIKNDCLLPLGVEVSDTFPVFYARCRKSGPYQSVDLSSWQSNFLAEQYRRWYAPTGEWVGDKSVSSRYRRGDTKITPRDLALSPITLTHWFIGDGGSNWTKTRPSTVIVSLATCCFTEEEVCRLTTMLNEMGIATIKPKMFPTKKGSGLVIYIAQESVDFFFDLIAPYMPSHKGLLQYKRNTPSVPGLREIQQLRRLFSAPTATTKLQ